MKKFSAGLLILTTILIIITGCTNIDTNQTNDETTYVKISAIEAKEFMENEELVILDVRTEEEYRGGHIENAILLPVNDIDNKVQEIITDKDTKILLYCRSGNRSATASKKLIQLGYTNVYDFGGINSWPYEIVK